MKGSTFGGGFLHSSSTSTHLLKSSLQRPTKLNFPFVAPELVLTVDEKELRGLIDGREL